MIINIMSDHKSSNLRFILSISVGLDVTISVKLNINLGQNDNDSLCGYSSDKYVM